MTAPAGMPKAWAKKWATSSKRKALVKRYNRDCKNAVTEADYQAAFDWLYANMTPQMRDELAAVVALDCAASLSQKSIAGLRELLIQSHPEQAARINAMSNLELAKASLAEMQVLLFQIQSLPPSDRVH